MYNFIIVYTLSSQGITDADAETRVLARECFAVFQSRFPDLAANISDSLDSNQRRQLEAVVSSIQSGEGFSVPLTRTNGVNSSQSSLSRQG